MGDLDDQRNATGQCALDANVYKVCSFAFAFPTFPISVIIIIMIMQTGLIIP